MRRSQATGESMTSRMPATGVTLHMQGLSGSRLNMTGHRTGILSEEITRKAEPCHGTLLWNIGRAVGSPRSCMCCATRLCRSAWWSCWQHLPSFWEPFGFYRATLLLPPICSCNRSSSAMAPWAGTSSVRQYRHSCHWRRSPGRWRSSASPNPGKA